jgi:hypothetical protein
MEDKVGMRKYIDMYKNREYKETPLLDNFKDVSQLIAKSYNGDSFRASLLLIYDVLMRKE